MICSDQAKKYRREVPIIDKAPQRNELAQRDESAQVITNSVEDPKIVGIRRSKRKRIPSTRLIGYKTN
jgi:hypothetical protein